MRRRHVLIGLTVACLAGQVALSQGDWLQGWREATVAIGVIDKANAKDARTGKFMIDRWGDTVRISYFRVIGTGVLCQLPDTSVKTPLLLTAKHVFIDKQKRWEPAAIQIRFAWFADRSVSEYLGITVNLRTAKGSPLWFEHPDTSVDLAAIPLMIPKADAGRDSVAPVRIEHFADENRAYEGASILLLGYPGAVGLNYWTRPVVRHGVVAFVDPYHFDRRPILVDAMIYPGNSGGPVFTVPTGMARNGSFAVGGLGAFLGIVSKAKQIRVDVEKLTADIELAETAASETHFRSLDYIGLGVIEPAGRVRELLEAITRSK